MIELLMILIVISKFKKELLLNAFLSTDCRKFSNQILTVIMEQFETSMHGPKVSLM